MGPEWIIVIIVVRGLFGGSQLPKLARGSRLGPEGIQEGPRRGRTAEDKATRRRPEADRPSSNRGATCRARGSNSSPGLRAVARNGVASADRFRRLRPSSTTGRCLTSASTHSMHRIEHRIVRPDRHQLLDHDFFGARDRRVRTVGQRARTMSRSDTSPIAPCGPRTERGADRLFDQRLARRAGVRRSGARTRRAAARAAGLGRSRRVSCRQHALRSAPCRRDVRPLSQAHPPGA